MYTRAGAGAGAGAGLPGGELVAVLGVAGELAHHGHEGRGLVVPVDPCSGGKDGSGRHCDIIMTSCIMASCIMQHDIIMMSS